jgi:hypothetical protein
LSGEDLSFVFQGPISDCRASEFLIKSIDILQEALPSCEIIVATWRESITDGLHQNAKVLTLDDPGDFSATLGLWNRFKFKNVNTKRMLYSSLQGVVNSSRKYCVKLRCDARMGDTSRLLDFVQELTLGASSDLFSRRPLVGNMFSRNPRRSAMLFHLSDIFIAGLRDDILKIFESAWISILALEESSETIPWLCPEQYLWSPVLTQLRKTYPTSVFTMSFQKAIEFESIVLKNIEIVDMGRLGITFAKEFSTSTEDCYTAGELRSYDHLRITSPKKYAIALSASILTYSLICRLKLLWLALRARIPYVNVSIPTSFV